jgi:hypothetical protein
MSESGDASKAGRWTGHQCRLPLESLARGCSLSDGHCRHLHGLLRSSVVVDTLGQWLGGSSDISDLFVDDYTVIYTRAKKAVGNEGVSNAHQIACRSDFCPSDSVSIRFFMKVSAMPIR